MTPVTGSGEYQLSEDSKRKIFWDNAIDFYRFPKDYIPTEFREASATED